MSRIELPGKEYDQREASRVRADIERALESINRLNEQIEAVRRGQELRAVRIQSMLFPAIGVTDFT